METTPAGYGLDMRSHTVVPVVLMVLLAGCFSESGLQDEVRQATDAIDTLVDEIGGSGPIRDAAGEAKEAVEESRAALEAFREDPNAETRQALLEAEAHLNDARTTLDGALEGAPEAVRGALGDAVDALERIRRSIREEFED